MTNDPNLKALFLDFDGVIMNSLSLKNEAYAYAVEEYGLAFADIEERADVYAGLSRFQIVPNIVEDLTGLRPDEATCERLIARFTERDDALRPQMQLLPGCKTFLDAMHGRLRLAVVTGTPQFAIDATADVHELRHWFDTICGSPPGKIEVVARLLTEWGLTADQCIFMGDGMTDQKAAQAHGMRFIGVRGGAASFDAESADLVINRLDELLPER
jgi:phosphoglycolate phosphatase-like HAD superfamily hydrolase